MMGAEWKIVNERAIHRALDGFLKAIAELRTEGIAAAVDPYVSEARSRAQGGGTQARRAASGLRIERGRTPRVVWGGAGAVVSGGASIGELSGGVEYGGPSFFPSGGRRFPAPHTPQGRYLIPTLTQRSDDIVKAVEGYVVDAWNRAARRSR